MSHREGTKSTVGQTSLVEVERIFSGGGGKSAALFRKALKYDRRNAAGYPCPVQLGALNDPCDHIERNQGWLLRFIPVAIKYRQPVRISTKGTAFQLPDYQRAVAQAPELFWVAFSTISIDDVVLRKVDVRAPSASERLKTMGMLSKLGVRTSLRFRPILPGISDATSRHPMAWRELIDRAAEAGAYAISCEVGFVPGTPSKAVRWRWGELGKAAGVDFFGTYAKFGRRQACTRPAYGWTEEIMHAITEHARACGLVVGVSDPVWKQLGDTGCCCGMLPDDPIWGNWQRESATNRLLEAKSTGTLIGPDDVVPAWARDVMKSDMVNAGVGPLVVYKRKHTTWADELRATWNNLHAERGPLNYFQGALMPEHVQDGDVYYKYVGLQRRGYANVAPWRVRRA